LDFGIGIGIRIGIANVHFPGGDSDLLVFHLTRKYFVACKRFCFIILSKYEFQWHGKLTRNTRRVNYKSDIYYLSATDKANYDWQIYAAYDWKIRIY